MTVLSRGKRVVIIGDSHMEALGPRLRTRLPRAAGVIVQHVEPRRGWSARRYVGSGIVRGITRGADVVIFELGGNDASANVSPARHARDIATLISQAAPAQVIWVGPGVTLRPELEAARAPLRATQARVVPEQGGAWVDAQPMTRTADLAPDGVHFRAAGYTRWADQLAPALASVSAGAGGIAPQPGGAQPGKGGAAPSIPGGSKPGGGTDSRWWVAPAILAGTATLALAIVLWSRRR
ncbi:MAG TPA: SGNH/GDSL hydrolase family protein [Myxococcota bacterium]